MPFDLRLVGSLKYIASRNHSPHTPQPLHTSVDGVDWPLDSAERIDKAAVKMKAVNKVNAESMSTYVAAMEEKHAAMAVEKAARDAKHRKEIRLAGGKVQWERNQSRLRCGMTALPPLFAVNMLALGDSARFPRFS